MWAFETRGTSYLNGLSMENQAVNGKVNFYDFKINKIYFELDIFWMLTDIFLFVMFCGGKVVRNNESYNIFFIRSR